ncbi:ABC transporter permease [Paenarthrobacter sp. Z7-10]|uniref:ABC transporter permease n=1 Tax=Paenarthrobacter sp. Z7-10 TaxID=2787635 RepID=UPI0022A954BF|nr:ABC transporter permease [Paenarthrobacter sp. Z7-10]MCZ2402955.1 ABC transporter permease [Paenarthrobacter sp. Z7-10]
MNPITTGAPGVAGAAGAAGAVGSATRRLAARLAVRLAARVLPPLIAVLLVLSLWEVVFLAGWRPPYVLPAPAEVLQRFAAALVEAKFWVSLTTTLIRAFVGFGLAVLIGTGIGLLVSGSRVLRSAIGSLITGMQTMPSIAWFPFAILLFGLSEQAIEFVVVLGAAPSIANGLISGIDEVPPPLLRTAKALGAKGLVLYRHIVLPAALPAYLSGLKQGWAFAWRSLMAGELLVIIASRPSLGAQLQFFREFADTAGLMSTMLVILLLGMAVDGGFSYLSRRIQARRGLGTDRASARG